MEGVVGFNIRFPAEVIVPVTLAHMAFSVEDGVKLKRKKRTDIESLEIIVYFFKKKNLHIQIYHTYL